MTVTFSAREVMIDGRTTVVPACSGKTLSSDAARQDVVDSVLHVASEAPLHLRYTAATRPERGRATDRLSLNCLADPRTWKKGHTPCPDDLRHEELAAIRNTRRRQERSTLRQGKRGPDQRSRPHVRSRNT